MADAPAIPRDLWLQRSRLNGMILSGFVYGVFFLLTIQATLALRHGRNRLGKWQIRWLYAYIFTTFILSTMCFGCNARYTEDIWINFAGPGGRTPEDLILNEFDYWWNRMAVVSTFVMIWIMDLLLLYRCFVIFNYQLWVEVLMTTVYLGIVALSIAVMYYAQHSAVFFNIKVQIAFLVLSCTFNLLFTFLISIRLLSVRKQIIDTLGAEHAKTYTSVTATLVESAALYFVFDVIFVFAFGLKSNVQNLILLEYSSIQGIAELLIIVRVARGQDYDSTVTTSPTKLSRMDFRRNATSERGDTGVGIGFGGRPTQTTTGHGEDVQEQVRARVVSLELRRGGSDSEKDKEKDGAKDAAKQVITKDFV